MRFRSLYSFFVLALFHSLTANAQISKGNQILINRGLQLQGLSKDDCYLHLDTYSNANYTSILWNTASRPDLLGTAPGFAWARWAGDESNVPPQISPMGGDETPFMDQLVTLQLSDEWDLNNDTVRTRLVDWFNAVRSNYPNTILYHNSYGGQVSDSALADFYTRAQPDMLSFDTYPFWFDGSHVSGGDTPFQWYGDLRRYREHARNASIPFGCYIQAYHSVNEGVRDPSASEYRLQHFAALGFNSKVLMDFVYNTGATTLFDIHFNGSGDSYPNAMYYEKVDINRRARNFGKALVRLKPIDDAVPNSYTTGMMFVLGKDPTGAYNPAPIGFDSSPGSYTSWVADRNDPYLRGWAVTNKGTKNNGNPGDVIISWFKPLDESFDGPDYSNETYMMVVNGLCDPTGTPADCRQEIKLNFLDTFTKIEMLNPTNGYAEAQVLPVVSTRRQLVLNLNGGDAVLFKISDGAPFVGVPPVITTQPISQTNAAGTSATFSVAANGLSPLSYQWQFNGTNIVDATATTYTHDLLQLSDAGDYTVVITNSSGSVTSSVATLTVQVPPQITTQPQGRTTSVGMDVLFTVVATGNPTPSYQWRLNGTNIAAANASSYTRTNVQTADSGAYSVVVTNPVGGATSSDAVLIVNGPPFISGQPQNQAAILGGTASFNVTAIGASPLSYHWQKDNSNLSDSATVSGSTTTALTVNSLQAGDFGNYKVLVTNPYGTTVSTTATLTIATQPVIDTQPQSQTNNGGATVTFNVIASGGGLNYQWQRSATNILDGGRVSGAATATLTLRTVSKGDATNYTVVITNPAGTVTSSAAALSLVFPLPWREPFNYDVGSNIGVQTSPNGLVWTDVGTSQAGPYITNAAGNLSIQGLAPSFGNAIQFGGLGKSARLSFPSAFTSGTAYYSLALKVLDLTGASASGGLFAGFNNSTGTQTSQPSVVGTRLYLRTTAGGFNLGVAKNSDVNTSWDSTVYTTNDTIFIVGSYTFGTTANTTDDISKLWINPTVSTFGSATAPAATLTATAGNDITASQAASFLFFQRSTTLEAAAMVADDLRIGTTWASVTPAISPVQLTSATFVNGSLQLHGTADPANIIIQGSSDLSIWTDVTNLFSTNGSFQAIDSSSSLKRFYRAKIAP